jgi:uncharacterized protein (TIGR03435 family)
MKPDERNIDEILEHSLPTAPRGQMDAALDRVFARLQSDRGWTVAEPRADVDVVPVVRWSWRPAVTIAVATVAVAAAVWLGASLRVTGDDAVLEIAGGSSSRIGAGQIVKAIGDGSMLALPDGSRVEMRAQSELAWARADDGLTIRLRTGSIIVNAAKQRSGHLYVQTKDMTVAVVGTVFLVNAEKDGSRVAVIEGEVRVQEGTIETRLRPGEQVATSRTAAARPLKEEIAWSRDAGAHLSILEAFEKGIAATTGPRTPLANAARSANAPPGQAAAAAPGQEFEEAAIRPCDLDNLPPTPAGARAGGANSFQMTPGRTYALCMTPATLIRTAYGYGPADLDFLTGGRLGGGRGMSFNTVYGLGVEDGIRVRGGPDWIRSERYTIDAVANGPASAETMRRQMLQTLLERRFQLKAHIETEQIPAFSLTVAPGGLKMKPVVADGVNASGFVNTTGKDGGACEVPPTVGRGQPVIARPARPGERQPPPPATPGEPVTILSRNFVDVRRGEKPTCGTSIQRNGPNQVLVAGAVTLAALGQTLGSPLGGVQVLDRTGNTDKFNFVLEFVIDENTPGPRFLTPRPVEASDVARGQTIFVAIEEQLGLRLEPARVPREFIVIDAIERPSAN